MGKTAAPNINHLLRAFPNLRIRADTKTSNATVDYNCIAWAFGDAQRVWWPAPIDGAAKVYWPGPREESTTVNFVRAFQRLGYEVCDNGRLEEGYDKIVIYEVMEGLPTHAARQLPNGRWTSKLGKDVDIQHTLADLNGGNYGDAKIFMKKRREAPEPPAQLGSAANEEEP